jgi:predicted transposase/invertase (TIGR01784 family)
MIFGEYDREMDIAVNRREAREEGREEGIGVGLAQGREDGHKEEKQIIAKNLLAKGSTLEFVQEITGLSLEEIEQTI